MIVVQLTDAQVQLALRFAKDCALGGVSRVREPNAREQSLDLDQRVGQLGTIALHVYWFGHAWVYAADRIAQNETPNVGDGGEDIAGCTIDVKTSLMRKSQNPETYSLLVRPRERHADWIYVAAFIAKDFDTTHQITLAGWCTDAELPKRAETDFPFEGAFRMPVAALHPLPPICWSVTATE